MACTPLASFRSGGEERLGPAEDTDGAGTPVRGGELCVEECLQVWMCSAPAGDVVSMTAASAS